MVDRSLVRDLRRWATEEFNLPPDSLPNDGNFKMLCIGTGESIWKYVIQHVFQQRNVRIMRGNLQWYKVIQDKELKQTEGQSEAAKQKDLQRKIEQLKSEISHLDSQISGTEEQLATQEQSVSRTWAQVEDSRRREMLLQAFRQRCIVGRQELSDDTQKISGHCQTLEQMSRRAEVEVLFDNKPSSSSDGDNLNSKAAAEAQVLHEVRELCECRVRFYQSLQDGELKTTSKHMSREQRTAVFQYWLSAVENLLGGYPPSHILSALQYLASREQEELEEKLSALNVMRDVTNLKFRYESNHLLDMSAEEDDLPSVKSLLEDAWEEVEQSLVQLALTRSRVQLIQNQLQVRRGEAEQEVSSITEELHNDTLALSALEVELQVVMQAAARDHIRERCIQLDQQARSRQEALRSLHSQWQSILDFRQLVVLRQEDIRGLIKGNSTAKTELIRLHRELRQFVLATLVPEFEVVSSAASSQRNCISKEARQLGTISLPALDRRTTEGGRRIAASWLSIHRLQAPAFSSLGQTLEFPLYRAPEELCSQARSQQLELRFLRQLLKLHSATLQDIQKEVELLHAPDQKALLSRVMEEDQKLLECLVPRVRGLTQRSAQGLSYGVQVKTAISYWWDQPAQHVLPEVQKGGMTFQQWLQRWRLAAKAS
ncbi:HAUS augmin-like complex subunit 5 [Gymnodraco acuticeps]|uniref:HAUS augmin-like complex subunit 5 n=1 Tax=Gymnodraco acuticeps TaxID=8218 RepID=A0A6P8SU76_GYMAC|nr:HAUS augmin-like complex subunit 5 [Gymnodraco acuticeps]